MDTNTNFSYSRTFDLVKALGSRIDLTISRYIPCGPQPIVRAA